MLQAVPGRRSAGASTDPDRLPPLLSDSRPPRVAVSTAIAHPVLGHEAFRDDGKSPLFSLALFHFKSIYPVTHFELRENSYQV